MNLRKLSCATLLAGAACGNALAIIVVTPGNPPTMHFENFNGGTDFAINAWLNASFTDFIVNNAGPGAPASALQYRSSSLTNLAADDYALTFSKIGRLFNSVKVDDVSVSVTAVPEPDTYGLMLAGLAGIGFVALRRRPTQG